MLEFDTSGGLIFRYPENPRALPAKSPSPKFSVSISGGAAAPFVAHFSGKHQRDHFLVCPPRPQRMLKRGWPVVLRRSLRESVILPKSRRVARETSWKFAFAIVLAWPWPDDCLYQSRPRSRRVLNRKFGSGIDGTSTILRPKLSEYRRNARKGTAHPRINRLIDGKHGV